MKKNGNILIVDDNRGVLAALQLLLKPHFERIATLTSPASLPAMLREDTWSVLLLDMNFTSGINNGNEGLYWLHEAKRLRPALPVVLFTAYADIDLAVRGIKEGATDFVVKPWENHKLVETLTAASRNNDAASAKDCPANEKPAMYWGADGCQRAHHGRERHGQGDAGARTPPPLPAERTPAGVGGHGRYHGNPLRERTVRSRQPTRVPSSSMK